MIRLSGAWVAIPSLAMSAAVLTLTLLGACPEASLGETAADCPWAAFGRRLVAEARLTVDDLIAPLFVREGIDEPQPIVSLPGVVQHTRESVRAEVKELAGS